VSSNLTLLHADTNKTNNAKGNIFTNLYMMKFPRHGYTSVAKTTKGHAYKARPA